MSGDHELAVERLMDAPLEAVWRAWTEHLPEWWCPKPWTTEVIEHDLRNGGRSALIMRGPNGEGGEAMEGVFLEVTPRVRIVFTSAFRAGWLPQESPLQMVGFFEFADAGGGRTQYRAGARHWTADACERHRAMGFEAGWATVAEQLEAVAKRIA